MLKLNKNLYPLLDVHDETVDPVDKISDIKIRKHDAPAPFDLNIYQKITILDHFNTDFLHCELCLLPYSYKPVWDNDKGINTCVFCYLLHKEYPPKIYASLDNSSTIAMEDISVKISSEYFELKTNQELMDKIRKETELSSKETSLDQFF